MYKVKYSNISDGVVKEGNFDGVTCVGLDSCGEFRLHEITTDAGEPITISEIKKLHNIKVENF